MATNGTNGTGGANGQPSGWWKTALMAAGAVVAGAMASWSGINSRMDAHAADITRMQLHVDHQGKQLDRVEGKIDRLIGRPQEK